MLEANPIPNSLIQSPWDPVQNYFQGNSPSLLPEVYKDDISQNFEKKWTMLRFWDMFKVYIQILEFLVLEQKWEHLTCIAS